MQWLKIKKKMTNLVLSDISLRDREDCLKLIVNRA